MGIPASAGARTGRRVTYTSYLYHNATKTGGTAAASARLGTSLEQSAPESLTPPSVVSFSPTSGESLPSLHQILNHSIGFDAKTHAEALTPRVGSRSLRNGFVKSGFAIAATKSTASLPGATARLAASLNESGCWR
jgi:hypothetical protein